MVHLLGSTTFLGGLGIFIVALFYLLGFLRALFVIICMLMVPLILVQKGKGNMGLSAVGSGAQVLFGGSGGQNLFQKITWVLGALFMGGSLLLSLYTTGSYHSSRLLNTNPITQQQAQ
ncbi:MAG: preprotein translocase subunit SecG [Candidatus Babeliales bacterium]